MSQKRGATLGRRALFRMIAAAGLTPGCAVLARAQTRVQSGITIILDVTGAASSPALVGDLLEPLLDEGIPLGLIHSEFNDPHATRAALQLARRAGGILEIIPYSVGIVDRRPFFRMHAAHVARELTDRLLDGAQEAPPPRPIVIATDDPGEARSFEGVRTAGFRHVFRVPVETAPPDARSQEGQVSVISGGVVAGLSATDRGLVEELASRIGTAPIMPVYLNVRNAGQASRTALRARMRELARQIAAWRGDGSAIALLPSDYAVWTGEPAAPMLVLRVEAPPRADSAARESFDRFMAMLGRAGIGFSVDRPVDGRAEIAGGDCLTITGPAAAPFPGGDDPAAGARRCMVAPTADDSALAALAARGWETALLPPDGASQGLDRNGLLRLPSDRLGGADRGGTASGPPARAGSDVILAVPADAYRTEALRSVLVARLLSASERIGAPWRGLPQYLSETRPADPVFDMMQATRAPAPKLIAPAADRVAAEERARLVEDARHAWSYIAETTIPATGLCPSTVRFDRYNPTSYGELTMWDVGSLLQGVLAARDIGLIDEAEFLIRTEAILEQLPNRRIDGLRLPSAAIPANGVGAHTAAFDACDTGRLLSALRDVSWVPGLRQLVSEIVGAWQLADTVRDGHVHSFDGRRTTDAWWSHCGPYAARAYGLWGIDAASPYPRMTAETPTLSRMRLLYEVAAIGALGAEPLLLEPLELGPTPAGSYATDVLFRAQADAFIRTGDLYCVSESPIDEPPWFSYQGLNLNESDNRWVANFVEAQANDAPARRRDPRAVVSKAAYLWSAIRPSDYSDLLVAYVREKAVLQRGGFASAVFVADGRPTANYTDVNTSGVILSSIAYILRGRRPRAADGSRAADGAPT